MLKRLFVKLINCEWINADNVEHLTVGRLVLGSLGLQFSEIWGWDMDAWSKAGSREGGAGPLSYVPALPSSPPGQRAPSPHPLNVNVCLCFHSFCSETLFCFFFPQSLVEISSLHRGLSHRKPWSPFGLTKPPSVPCPRLWLVSTSGPSFPSSPPFPLDHPLPLARCRV